MKNRFDNRRLQKTQEAFGKYGRKNQISYIAKFYPFSYFVERSLGIKLTKETRASLDRWSQSSEKYITFARGNNRGLVVDHILILYKIWMEVLEETQKQGGIQDV